MEAMKLIEFVKHRNTKCMLCGNAMQDVNMNQRRDEIRKK